MDDHLNFINAQKYNIMPNIETSNRCPLQCPQCTRAKLFEPKTSSRYKEIKSRIDNGSDLSLEDAEKLLKFFSKGIMLCGQLSDPVYWKNFIDFLKLRQTKYPNSELRIHTAASQKNLEWYQKAFQLCNEKVVWAFGIDGITTSELYRKGQNSKLMFEAMLVAKSMKIGVEWHFIVFQHNVHEVELASQLAVKYNIDLFFTKSNRTGGGIEIPEDWRAKKNKEIIKK